MQAAVQLLPLVTLAPCVHDGLAAFEMLLGAEHGSGLQENVDGVKEPALQLRDAVSFVANETNQST